MRACVRELLLEKMKESQSSRWVLYPKTESKIELFCHACLFFLLFQDFQEALLQPYANPDVDDTR